MAFLSAVAPMHHRMSLHKALRGDFPGFIQLGSFYFRRPENHLPSYRLIYMGCQLLASDVTSLVKDARFKVSGSFICF